MSPPRFLARASGIASSVVISNYCMTNRVARSVLSRGIQINGKSIIHSDLVVTGMAVKRGIAVRRTVVNRGTGVTSGTGIVNGGNRVRIIKCTRIVKKLGSRSR